jgi:isoprenylcysteine carboxyl methyltransferase (ICMT) family protein YpbQ
VKKQRRRKLEKGRGLQQFCGCHFIYFLYTHLLWMVESGVEVWVNKKTWR